MNAALGPYDCIAKQRATTWNRTVSRSTSGIGLASPGLSETVAEWGFNPIVGSNGNGTGDVTLIVLANPISEARTSILIGSMMTGAPYKQLQLGANLNGDTGVASAGSLSIEGYNGANQGFARADGVLDGKFHVFVGVYRGPSGLIYVDGVDKTSASGAGTGGGGLGDFGLDASSRISVGNESYGTTRTMNASVPFAAAFNRALSPAEVREVSRNIWSAWAFPTHPLYFASSTPPPPGGYGFIKVSGSWKTLSGTYVKVAGVWKDSHFSPKVSGAWKTLV